MNKHCFNWNEEPETLECVRTANLVFQINVRVVVGFEHLF